MTSFHALDSMLARSPAFPKMSSAQAKRGNLVAAATGIASFKVGAVPVTARLVAPDTILSTQWRMEFQLAHNPLSIWCTHDLLARLLLALDPGLKLDPNPGVEMLALLVEALLQEVPAQWATTLGTPLVFTMIEPARRPSGSTVPVELDIGKKAYRVGLDGGQALDALLSKWPQDKRPDPPISVPAWFCLGTTELPLEVIRSLRTGDAIVIEHRYGADMPLRFAGGWQAAARLQAASAVLLGKPGPAQDPKRKIRMPASQDDDFDTLPVRLDFEIGHRDFSLAELRALQPGVVVSLGRPAAEFVEITANGRRIGCGELVEVEGAIAVRITKLYALG